MKTIEEQLKLLKETANHFNSQNRGTDEKGRCCYYHSEEGRGCAIGRLIKDKELCKELDLQPNTRVKYVFDKLPADLQEYGKGFLTELQTFHDTSSYWDEKELNFRGKDRYNTIAKSVKEGQYQS